MFSFGQLGNSATWRQSLPTWLSNRNRGHPVFYLIVMKVKLVLMKLMTMHWGIIIIIIELWHHHYCTSSPSSSLHCGIKLTLELVRDLRLHLLLSGRCSLQLHSVCYILYFVLQVLLLAPSGALVSSVRSSSGYHGLIEIRQRSKPLFQIFQFLQILKWKWKWKDPTCAIFLKSMGFKDIEYDIPVYQM